MLNKLWNKRPEGAAMAAFLYGTVAIIIEAFPFLERFEDQLTGLLWVTTAYIVEQAVRHLKKG